MTTLKRSLQWFMGLLVLTICLSLLYEEKQEPSAQTAPAIPLDLLVDTDNSTSGTIDKKLHGEGISHVAIPPPTLSFMEERELIQRASEAEGVGNYSPSHEVIIPPHNQQEAVETWLNQSAETLDTSTEGEFIHVELVEPWSTIYDQPMPYFTPDVERANDTFTAILYPSEAGTEETYYRFAEEVYNSFPETIITHASETKDSVFSRFPSGFYASSAPYGQEEALYRIVHEHPERFLLLESSLKESSESPQRPIEHLTEEVREVVQLMHQLNIYAGAPSSEGESFPMYLLVLGTLYIMTFIVYSVLSLLPDSGLEKRTKQGILMLVISGALLAGLQPLTGNIFIPSVLFYLVMMGASVGIPWSLYVLFHVGDKKKGMSVFIPAAIHTFAILLCLYFLPSFGLWEGQSVWIWALPLLVSTIISARLMWKFYESYHKKPLTKGEGIIGGMVLLLLVSMPWKHVLTYTGETFHLVLGRRLEMWTPFEALQPSLILAFTIPVLLYLVHHQHRLHILYPLATASFLWMWTTIPHQALELEMLATQIALSGAVGAAFAVIVAFILRTIAMTREYMGK